MRRRTQGCEGYRQDVIGVHLYYNGGSATSKEVLSNRYKTNFKICLDEIHPRYPREGGPLSIRSYTEQHSAPRVKSGYVGYASYSGIVYDCERRVYPNAPVAYPEDGLDATAALGAEAWNRFSPSLTKVNLGQFLAEAKDIPSLFKLRLLEFKDLGSSYLQYQFGWRPFLSDLRSWLQSYRELDKQVENLRKHNGKWLKRSGTLYNNHDVVEDSLCYVAPQNYLQSIKTNRRQTVEDRAWFSGSFRYYVPGLTDGKWGKLKISSKLWGLELTPSLVYELTPWSWLVDWFSNTGDVISNYTKVTQENMAAKYAYVMRYTRSQIDCEASYVSRFTEYMKPTLYQTNKSTSRMVSETKCRSAASPFGFDLKLADFSNYQLSILAALGISRF